MPRYAAFLRGMNLGGRRITNDELRSHFEALGFEDVAAFLASGNVVFTAASSDAREIAQRIEAGLEAALGYAVPTFLRSAEEVRSIAARAPFSADQIERSAGKPQIAILATRPTAADRETVLTLATDDDRLAFGDRELHWLPAGPMSKSELDLRAIEKTLGAMTIRTARTVERLVGKYF